MKLNCSLSIFKTSKSAIQPLNWPANRQMRRQIRRQDNEYTNGLKVEASTLFMILTKFWIMGNWRITNLLLEKIGSFKTTKFVLIKILNYRELKPALCV